MILVEPVESSRSSICLSPSPSPFPSPYTDPIRVNPWSVGGRVPSFAAESAAVCHSVCQCCQYCYCWCTHTAHILLSLSLRITLTKLGREQNGGGRERNAIEESEGKGREVSRTDWKALQWCWNGGGMVANGLSCQLQWTVRQQSAIPIVLDCTSSLSIDPLYCASRILAEFGLAATEDGYDDSSTGGDLFFFLPLCGLIGRPAPSALSSIGGAV